MAEEKKFLIKNYNLKKEKYELGKEGIIKLNKVEFKTLLNELPIQTSYPFFQIEIYYRKLSIVKTRKDTCVIFNTQLPIQFGDDEFYNKLNNKSKLSLPIDKIVSLLYDESKLGHSKLSIVNIKEIIKADYTLTKAKKAKKKEKVKEKWKDNVIILIALILGFLYILIIASVFFMLIYVPIRYLEMMNFLSFTFWVWLLSLSPVNVYHMIRSFTTERTTQIKFNIPILDHYKTTNISKWFINMMFTYGTLLLTIPLLIINLPNIDAITLLVIGSISIIMHIWIIIRILLAYSDSKDIKEKILQSLLKYLQEEDLTWSEKQYYLLLILEFKKKKKVSIGYYSKIYALLTLLFSIIPKIF